MLPWVAQTELFQVVALGASAIPQPDPFGAVFGDTYSNFLVSLQEFRVGKKDLFLQLMGAANTTYLRAPLIPAIFQEVRPQLTGL